MADLDRIAKTFAYMREHLDQWNQDQFMLVDPVCGTSMCLAGFATHLFAEEFGMSIVMGMPDARGKIAPTVRGSEGGMFFFSGKKIFDLTFEEAHMLFIDTVGVNDIDELEVLVYQALEAPMPERVSAS